MITATRSQSRLALAPRRPSLDAWTVIGLLCFFGLVFIALFGERIAPNEQIYFVLEHDKDPRPFDPGLVFPLGSDVLGRDLFSVVLAGARATLTIVLLAGLARVIAGIAVAAAGSLWRPARIVTETFADLVAAVPATLLTVLLVKAFVRTDTSIPIVIGALLLVGWAGPYRVLRAEVDRLARAPFTEGARSIGVTGRRIFWRHHVPNLVPVLATNLSQQVVASLVLLAELGVLGVIVSTVRQINVEESLTLIRTGPQNHAPIPDVPEWGALLSSARTVEILWVTRWVIFIPGAAFAVTAMAVALIGFAIARRYARRDIFRDARAGVAIAVGVAAMFLVADLVPERYAEAREWAARARAEVHDTPDVAAAFAEAGLETHSVTRRYTTIVRTAAATVRVGDVTLAEPFPQPELRPPRELGANEPLPPTVHMRSLVSDGLGGGGTVEAPVVFASRGIDPAEHRPPAVRYLPGKPKVQLDTLLGDYANDYAGIDVRGKVVLLARFAGIDAGVRGLVDGFTPGESISGAIKRGASAVIFVDPFVGATGSSLYPNSIVALNPYVTIEREFPPRTTSGVPVIAIDPEYARTLFGPLGVDVQSVLGYDPIDGPRATSKPRALGVSARVDVPLHAEVSAVTSLIGEVPGFAPDTGRILVLAAHVTNSTITERNRRDVLGGIARFAAASRAPFVVIDFDPRADADAIREFLIDRRVIALIVLEDLDRDTLQFTTANGDLIPAIDLYADKAGAPHLVTRRTYLAEQVGSPLAEYRTIVITTAGEPRDSRADMMALLGYMAGRLALGAPELAR